MQRHCEPGDGDGDDDVMMMMRMILFWDVRWLRGLHCVGKPLMYFLSPLFLKRVAFCILVAQLAHIYSQSECDIRLLRLVHLDASAQAARQDAQRQPSF